ncbi:D-alanyl-D-alanine carboxypeptidase [Sinosporangium siamense]|uniref:D-alanyl-D-alanine carboxypeptidase n=2 Tax=Sinosporangium siamense TaxID=1367973 RepID=A0A919RN80_9ACTN|nr:D-alanyl-D-alanine carboxypeptidase [Sinosporangium siamense]
MLTGCAVLPEQSADAVRRDPAPRTADTPKGGLTPGTRKAYHRAAKAAAAAGHTLHITSGYRTAEQQRSEFRQAVRKYGSAAKAREYVLPPEKSAHVKGLAIDVGPEPAARWLESTNGRYGLCRIYANEWWHFEFSYRYARERRCPDLKPDATAAG